MKRYPRHISRRASLLLTALILFQGIGWLLLWQAAEWQAIFAAQRALLQKETPVREFVLHRDFFLKSRVGKREVCLDGDLYDIRSREDAGDSVKLVLYHDWPEQLLYNILHLNFPRLERDGGDKTHATPAWVARWLDIAFILPADSSLVFSGFYAEKLAFSWRFSFTSPFHVSLFRPPRI